jgi:hypothetical protein
MEMHQQSSGLAWDLQATGCHRWCYTLAACLQHRVLFMHQTWVPVLPFSFASGWWFTSDIAGCYAGQPTQFGHLPHFLQAVHELIDQV